MYLEFSNIDNILSFCFSIILKEAKEEHKLIKQIFYTMLSTYTNYPINLAINSPTGEGKTYVLHKVGEIFPKEDVVFLAGMTDKALFHRSGVLVIKNESGVYEIIDDKIAEIDSEIKSLFSTNIYYKDRPWPWIAEIYGILPILTKLLDDLKNCHKYRNNRDDWL